MSKEKLAEVMYRHFPKLTRFNEVQSLGDPGVDAIRGALAATRRSPSPNCLASLQFGQSVE